MLRGNNTMKLLAVLAVLVGVFLLVKYTGNDHRSKSFRSTLVDIDTADVTKIVIQSPEDSTVLERKEKNWVVNPGKPADQNTVKSLMNSLQSISPSRIASRSEDQWTDFQVDDQGTRVAVYEGSDKTLDIILGRFNVEGQRSFYSYVRLADEPDTYVAKDFMKMTVASKSTDYRNDDVLRLEWDSIASVDFKYPDSAFTMYKVNESWQINGQSVDSAAMETYQRGTRFVTSTSFTEKPSELSNGVYEVVFTLNSDQIYQVTGYGEDRFGSSYNEAEFWQDPALKDKLFKGKSFFLKEE